MSRPVLSDSCWPRAPLCRSSQRRHLSRRHFLLQQSARTVCQPYTKCHSRCTGVQGCTPTRRRDLRKGNPTLRTQRNQPRSLRQPVQQARTSAGRSWLSALHGFHSCPETLSGGEPPISRPTRTVKTTAQAASGSPFAWLLPVHMYSVAYYAIDLGSRSYCRVTAPLREMGGTSRLGLGTADNKSPVPRGTGLHPFSCSARSSLRSCRGSDHPRDSRS